MVGVRDGLRAERLVAEVAVDVRLHLGEQRPSAYLGRYRVLGDQIPAEQGGGQVQAHRAEPVDVGGVVLLRVPGDLEQELRQQRPDPLAAGHSPAIQRGHSLWRQRQRRVRDHRDDRGGRASLGLARLVADVVRAGVVVEGEVAGADLGVSAVLAGPSDAIGGEGEHVHLRGRLPDQLGGSGGVQRRIAVIDQLDRAEVDEVGPGAEVVGVRGPELHGRRGTRDQVEPHPEPVAGWQDAGVDDVPG
ncbi:hypothetical protein GCM10027614_75440 [Micromonospora vulcania]